jgi:hypothetical protein
MMRMIFFLLLLISSSVFSDDAKLDNDLVREQLDVLMTVDQILADMETCEGENVDSGEQYCDPTMSRSLTLIQSYRANGIRFNQRGVRRHFDQLGYSVGSFGAFRANRNSIDIRLQGRNNFSMNVGSSPQMMNIVNENGQSVYSCQVENPEVYHSGAVRTTEALSGMTRRQRYDWNKFCQDFIAEEEIAFAASENNWRLPNGEPYRGCPAGMGWKHSMYYALCFEGNPSINEDVLEMVPHLNLPPAFTFMFDGFNAFDPSYFGGALAANVTGDESSFRTRIRDRDEMRYFAARESTAINTYSELYMRRLNENIDQPQLFYYDGTGFSQTHGDISAITCHNQMQDWLDIAESALGDQIDRPETIVMGFSNGGAAALRFQQSVGRAGHTTDLLITVDPIERLAGFFASRAFQADLLPDRHPNTTRHVNLYQTNDEGSLNLRGLEINLRSREVAEADDNINLTEDLNPKNSHIAAIGHDTTVERIHCEMNNVIQDTFNLCP